MSILQVVTIALPAAVGLAALSWQVISWRRTGARIKAKLATGQVSADGILAVSFASGKRTITSLPNADDTAPEPTQGGEPEPVKKSDIIPVMAVFAYNKGRTPVTITRCEYISKLGGDVLFKFQPLPDASPFGDRLPKDLIQEQVLFLFTTILQ
jgi:hypothetical protein